MQTDPITIECTECEARPGDSCVTWRYGMPFLSEMHEARQDRADEQAWEAEQEVTC